MLILDTPEIPENFYWVVMPYEREFDMLKVLLFRKRVWLPDKLVARRGIVIKDNLTLTKQAIEKTMRTIVEELDRGYYNREIIDKVAGVYDYTM